jgi:hypothetical protein
MSRTDVELLVLCHENLCYAAMSRVLAMNR